MIIRKKVGAALSVTSLLSTAMASAVMVASKQEVSKINLTIDSDIRTGRGGGDVEVTPTGDSTSLYYVDSWEVTNDDGDSWTKSKSPEVTIILGVEDEEECYFSSSSSSAFKLTLGSSSKYRFDKIKFVDAERKDSNATLILTIQLIFDRDANTSAATAPANLQRDGEYMGAGLWNIVSSSKYYQIQLIKDGSEIGEIKDTYDTFYDFPKQIIAPGTYRFKVRSVKSSNSVKSSWIASGSRTVSDEDVPALGNTPAVVPVVDNGNWQTSEDGTRWWWRNGDGGYLISAWKEIDGEWHYFNADGHMVIGWVEVSGKGYYLDPATGATVINARTSDNYQVDKSGEWVPGAQIFGAQIPGAISVCRQRGYRLIPTFNP